MEHAQVRPPVERDQAVFDAISALTLEDGPVAAAWDELDILSSATLFEGIEAAPGGVVFSVLGRFEAAATIYVTLQYGGSRDSVSMSDAYPAEVFGSIDEQGEVQIDRIDVDTQSFYADE